MQLILQFLNGEKVVFKLNQLFKRNAWKEAEPFLLLLLIIGALILVKRMVVRRKQKRLRKWKSG
jgi:hypothetical protein